MSRKSPINIQSFHTCQLEIRKEKKNKIRTTVSLIIACNKYDTSLVSTETGLGVHINNYYNYNPRAEEDNFNGKVTFLPVHIQSAIRAFKLTE